MIELEMLDKKIIPTDLFGALSIKCVLIEYDYPRAFIAESEGKELFALVEHSDADSSFGWNVAKTNLEQINKVNNGESNFQSLFINAELFLLDYDSMSRICRVKSVDGFYDKYEIKGNLLLKDFCDMDEVFDYHGFLKTATNTNKKSISYVIEGYKKLVTESVFKAIKYLSDICKNLDHPINLFKSDFAVQNKSTVLTFTFEDSKDGTVFEGTENIDENETGINELGNLLSSSDTASMIAESGKNNAIILQKLSAFMNLCSKDHTNDPRIVIAKPNSSKITSLRFGKDSTIEKRKAVNEARRIVKENISKTTSTISPNPKGILTGINTKNGNSFGFEEIGTNNYYSGLVDFNLINKETVFEVKGIYEATIEKTTISNNDKVLKESYKLVKLIKIDEKNDSEQLDIFNQSSEQ